MALRNEEDELQYRAPFGNVEPAFMEEPEASDSDQQDFSTLKHVNSILDQYISDLRSNFNIFDVFTADDPDVAAKDLLVQVRSKQETHRILVSLKETINGSIEQINLINKK